MTFQTVLHGKHFALCDDRGDIVASHGAQGLYAHDTRHLAHWVLRVDGALPQELGDGWGRHFERRFVQRNIRVGDLPSDRLLIDRHLVVGDAMYERIAVRNVTEETVRCTLTIEAWTDFGDIFTIKQEAFSELGDAAGEAGLKGAEAHARVLPTAAGEASALFENGDALSVIDASEPFELDGEGRLTWRLAVPARETQVIDVRVAWEREAVGSPLAFDEHHDRAAAEHDAWLERTPELGSRRAAVRRTWRRSINDLAALRIPHDDDRGMLPAAGLPWFMTVFGRDTLITCIQTMALKAERAMSALTYLARLQATQDDPEADAEPGKILHEVREGAIAARGYGTYYGSIDSTPLFLVTLDEVHLWTGDDAFVEQMRGPAMAALEWIERHGDANGDGYLDYRMRSSQGLDNQSWKDSWDSQRFSDGRFAEGPIAPVEAQGYAYDARVRTARLAREVWGDGALADRLEADAAALRERFERDFFVPANESPATGGDDPRRDGFYALALDGEGRRVDSLTSNIGHLLASGIVGDERAAGIAEQLTHPALFNGWGVRTMSNLDAAYNPIAYHNGTVWPHDTGLCIAGLVRYGHVAEASRLAHAMIDAAARFDGRLPEVFAGLDRERTGHPVEYPTASRPQAWAAGASIHAIVELLGLVPDPVGRRITTRGHAVPKWLRSTHLSGVQAFGRSWSVRVDRETGEAIVSDDGPA